MSRHPYDPPVPSALVLTMGLLLAVFHPLATAQDLEDADLTLPEWDASEWRQQAIEAAPPLAGGLLPSLGEAAAAPATVNDELQLRFQDAPPQFDIEALSAQLSDGRAIPWFAAVDDAPAAASATQSEPALAIELRDLTPEAVETILQWPKNDPLVDPTAELSEMEADELRRFLGYHATQARLPLRAIVTGKNHQLKDPAALTAITSAETNQLGGKPAALLIYPMGEPWRARLFLPPTALHAVSQPFLREAVEDCVAAARRTTRVESQLHDYLVQLSVRLFWIEKHLPPVVQSASPEPIEIAPPLAEVGSGDERPATVTFVPWNFLVTQWRTALAWVIGLLAAAGILMWAISVRRRSRARHLRTHVWMLPEVDSTPRLGGAFSGGAGFQTSW
ncbi:MAG: hypothetical protein KDK99_02920 [Verrucomicrobiales bacterium]|nr:hypothetical protein [Verrucomicrobiales bacterium]